MSDINFFTDMAMEWHNYLCRNQRDSELSWFDQPEGRADNPKWHATLLMNGIPCCRGSGKTRQHARDQAAYLALSSCPDPSLPPNLYRDQTMVLSRAFSRLPRHLSFAWQEQGGRRRPWHCTALVDNVVYGQGHGPTRLHARDMAAYNARNNLGL